MATYHRMHDEPTTVEAADGRMRFVISGDFMAFGIAGQPVFSVEGEAPGRISGQLPDSDGSAIAEGEWSPSMRFLPTWVEFDLFGRDEPDLHCRVELRDGVPKLVELSYRANESQSEIRQKHLRETELASLVNTVYRNWIREVRDVWRDHSGGFGVPAVGEEQDRILRNVVYDMKAGRRHINAELLSQVAEVYRDNFDHAPAEAVARVFGVRPRMAHEYIKRARERGFLPPTTQGKKKA
ncbi:hypothetical protein MHPYR_180007 [uncultured Mycobacterium sp.]|uniref:Uncharacterized protein n=1 Tax=uncultured Mycobacterium sp. TaxID=171292 RepID=A0A1Y5P4X1_9MYCO|nr:hypothetical protein MHPYR_180007 [uncultured Mycobacterium sp.]